MKGMNYIFLLFLSLSLTGSGGIYPKDNLIPEQVYTAVDNSFDFSILLNNQAGDIQDDDSNQNLPEKSFSNHIQIQSLGSKASLSIVRKKLINYSFANEICEFLVLDLPPPMLS